MLMIIFRFVTVGANIEAKNGKLTICPFFFFQFNIYPTTFNVRLPPRLANLLSFNLLIIVATLQRKPFSLIEKAVFSTRESRFLS